MGYTYGSEGVKIPVIVYHHISNIPNKIGTVTPEKFSEDLKTYKAAGYETIVFNDLISYLKGNIQLPKKPLIITLDDGYYSNYEYAYPQLKKNNMKAVMAVIGWSVGRNSYINSDKEIIPHFSWEQAKEMAKSGIIELKDLREIPRVNITEELKNEDLIKQLN